MKLQLWSVGKDHEAYVRAGVEDFTNRVSRYYPVEWVLLPVPKHAGTLPAVEMKKKEAEVVLGRLQKDDWLVALDERGKSMSSEGLADLLSGRANEGVRQLIFLIGGAYGLDPEVLKRANRQWSLSTLTFPHQLVRLILAEQLYRACSIIRNEKYHHS